MRKYMILFFVAATCYGQQPVIDNFPEGFNLQTNTLWTQHYQMLRDVTRGGLDYPFANTSKGIWRVWFLSSESATNRTATFVPDASISVWSRPPDTFSGDWGVVLSPGFDRTGAPNNQKNFTNEWGRNPYLGWHNREAQAWITKLAPRYGYFTDDNTVSNHSPLVYHSFGSFTNLANYAGLASNTWRRATESYPFFRVVTNSLHVAGTLTSATQTNVFDELFFPDTIDGEYWYNDPATHELAIFAEFQNELRRLEGAEEDFIAVNNSADVLGVYTGANGWTGSVTVTVGNTTRTPDPDWDEWEYGPIESGDYLGVWLFEDITKVADAMRISHYTKTNSSHTQTDIEVPAFGRPYSLEWERSYETNWVLMTGDLYLPYSVTNSVSPDLDGYYWGGSPPYSMWFPEQTERNQFFPIGDDWFLTAGYIAIASVEDETDENPEALGEYDHTGEIINPSLLVNVDDVDWRISARRDGTGWEIWNPDIPVLRVTSADEADAIGVYEGTYPSDTEYNNDNGWQIIKHPDFDDVWYLWEIQEGFVPYFKEGETQTTTNALRLVPDSIYPYGDYIYSEMDQPDVTITVYRDGYIRSAGTYYGAYSPSGTWTNEIDVVREYYQLLDPEGEQSVPTGLPFDPIGEADGTPSILRGDYWFGDGVELDVANPDVQAFLAIYGVEIDNATIAARSNAMNQAFTSPKPFLLDFGFRDGWTHEAVYGFGITTNHIDFEVPDNSFAVAEAFYTESETVRISVLANRTLLNNFDNSGAGIRGDLPQPTKAYAEMYFEYGELEGDTIIFEYPQNRVNFLFNHNPPIGDARTEQLLVMPSLGDFGDIPVREVDDPLTETRETIELLRDIIPEDLPQGLSQWLVDNGYLPIYEHDSFVVCPIRKYIIEWDRKYKRP